MARYWFGDSDDWSLSGGAGDAVRRVSAVRRCYADEAKTIPVIDLLIRGVTPADSVSMPRGLPVRFQGPDGVLSLWCSDNDGPAFLVVSTDAAQVMVDAAEGAVTAVDTLMSAAADDEDGNFRATLDEVVDDSIGTEAVRRTVRTQHAPALGLYFPEAEGASTGSSNNAAALAATFAAAPAGATVDLGLGNWQITSPIAITKAVKIKGPGAGYYLSRLMADGCNGFEVAAGVLGFQLEGIEVASKVRHSITPNTLVGIKVAGTTGSRPSNHVYRDVYVDGFWTAFQSCYLWSSNFDNFRCNYGLFGMDIYGLSVNNVVCNSHIEVLGTSGSRGIRLAGQEAPGSATDVGSEGWTIHDNVIFGGEIGVEIIGNTHIDVHDNIIDFCSAYGVLIRDNGTNFAGNCDIHDNYIAMTGTATAGINSGNAVTNAQNMANIIANNHLVVYSGSTCTNGIHVSTSQGFSIITGNKIKGFSSSGASILLACAGNTVIGNKCFDTPGAGGNIYASGYINHIEGNDGTVYLTGGNPEVYSVDALGKKHWVGLQAPTTGAHEWGETWTTSRPAAGAAIGGACVAAGTPGTWASYGMVGQATATSAQLAAIGNAINTADKYVGKTVFNTTTGKNVSAVGATAGSVWNDQTGTLAHTPV